MLKTGSWSPSSTANDILIIWFKVMKKDSEDIINEIWKNSKSVKILWKGQLNQMKPYESALKDM